MANRKSQRKAECPRVSGGAKRRRKRECGDRHQVIRTETVEESESEHGTGQHGGDYSGLWALGCGL
jgi:hypothetical protein